MPNRPAIPADTGRQIEIETVHQSAVRGRPLPLERIDSRDRDDATSNDHQPLFNGESAGSRDESSVTPEEAPLASVDAGSSATGAAPPEAAPDLWRSLLQVVGTSTGGPERMVEVVIPSWELDQTVQFRESLLPEEIRLQLTPGVRLLLLADVNIGETDPDKLVFRNFRLAPQPTWDL